MLLDGRARKCPMVVQNYRAIVDGANPLPTYLRPEENNLHREDDLDNIYEVREEARMRQQAAKELLAARYNKKVKSRELEEGDLVLRRADIRGKNALPSGQSAWKRSIQAPHC
ncbi:hypothetical protein PIB30_025421 [Stylosanthes scabra]|uniref:Uncharacterized protein n=1 Tax=Stylosanthes scabra TaxID=79078 RepID=A0ABU6SA59_9FABA|nr:hypothetical protein [Stylosanthes scabra]